MKSPLRYATFLVLLATVVTSGAAPDRHGASSDQEREVAHLRAAVQQLAAEVATLRRTVTGLELEQRRDRIRRIELELSRVRAEHEAVKKLEDAWTRMRGGSTP